MPRKRKDKCKFIRKLWDEVTNIDSWIEASKPWFVLLLMTFVAIYLIYDILGKVPEALHINLVMLSATLGGLVFAGASLNRKSDGNRKRMLNVAKKFIIATFLFIIFCLFFILIKDANIDPFDFSKGGFGYTIIFWVAALGIYGGSYFFALALVDFIISLRNIK